MVQGQKPLPVTQILADPSLRRNSSQGCRGKSPCPSRKSWRSQVCVGTILVGQGRLELPTSRLSGVYSNQLSYWPQRSESGKIMVSLYTVKETGHINGVRIGHWLLKHILLA